MRGMEGGSYKDFEATVLFCPYCKEPMPVKKKLLLILPEGEKYDYLCSKCGRPIGGKLQEDRERIVRP